MANASLSSNTAFSPHNQDTATRADGDDSTQHCISLDSDYPNFIVNWSEVNWSARQCGQSMKISKRILLFWLI